MKLLHVDREEKWQSITTARQPTAHVWLIRRRRALVGISGVAHGFTLHVLGRRLSVEWWRDA